MRNFIYLLAEKILSPNKQSWLWRYGIGILAVAIATILKLLLTPIILIESPFLLYFTAVMVSSWCGGWQVGILATIVSALMSDYFFLTPTSTLWVSSFGQIIPLGIF